MNLDAIVQEAERRLRELDAESARLRAVIAAARGVAVVAPAFPPWQPTVNPIPWQQPHILPWPQPGSQFWWTMREVKIGDVLPAHTICWGTTKIDNACAGGLGYYRDVGPGHYVVGMH